MLDWSYDLLPAEERRLLTWLAVFPQAFTLDQAEALGSGLCSTPVAVTLRHLVAASLVTPVGDRYRLLETVRLYATDKLIAADEAEAARDRHADSIVEWVVAVPDEVVFGTVAGAKYLDEMDHILAALRWFEQRGRLGDIAKVASRTVIAFSLDLPSVAPWLATGGKADDLTPEDRLRWMTASQWAAMANGDMATLAALDPDALPEARDPSGLLLAAAHAFRGLFHAIAWYHLGPEGAPGSDAAARDHAERGIAAVRESWVPTHPAPWFGLTYVGLGDLERALEILRWGAEAPRPPDGLTGACLAMAGIVEQQLGNCDAALEAMAAAQAIFATDPWGIATDFDSFWLATHAPILSAAGRHEDASEIYLRIIDRVRDEGSPPMVLQLVLGCMGVSATVRGAAEVGVQLLVRPVEQPISPLDHLIHSRYLEEASQALTPALVEELKARGRRLSFSEGVALALPVLT
jgi:hypothetical protein